MFPEVPYQITYNNLSPWGTGYNDGVPFVSVEVEEVYNAGQVGMIRTATLNGTIPSGGAAMITGIKNAFISNFKTFAAPNISMPNAMVQEITFSPQNYIGKVDYSIVLKDFSGFLYNVNDPSEEVSFQQEQDGSVTVNHKISAVGISPTLDAATALANAKAFVLARTGVNGTISILGTSYVPTTNKADLFLLTSQENINRALGTYSVTETYKYDPLRDTVNSTFKRFSVELNSGIGDDYVQVAVNGSYIAGQNQWNSNLLSQVSSTELYNLASAVVTGLNPYPLAFNVDTEEVTESTTVRSINARALFDNNSQVSYFDFDVDGSKDFRNGVTQISVKGQIMGSGRHVRRRFDSALNFFTNTVGGYPGAANYLYTAALSGATTFGYTNYAYNPRPKNISVIFNSGQGVINMSATFDDAPFVSGYTEFNWGVNSDCGLNIFKPHPSANQNGSYLIQDLGILNRTSVTINGNFSLPSTGGIVDLSTAKSNSILPLLMVFEGQNNAYLESQSYNISSGEAIKTGFNYQYTKNGAALGNIPSDGRIFKGTSI